LFIGRRAFVERTCDKWFILSAAHGLVDPSRPLDPYEMSLDDMTAKARGRWADRVLAALDREFPAMVGVTFEIHAGSSYRDHGLIDGLLERGAGVEVPAKGLSRGEQVSFYQSVTDSTGSFTPEASAHVAYLSVATNACRADEFPVDRRVADQPGLYAWWADDQGGAQLSTIVGEALPSLVYAGQAGATTERSGTERQATLLSRIRGNHLGGRISSSTFRKTLAALLRDELGLELIAPGRLAPEGEALLTSWMRGHLSVSISPHPDRATLSSTEREVLRRLDPPLNLMEMGATSVRHLLKNRRRELDSP
jgi:hypothetical protein